MNDINNPPASDETKMSEEAPEQASGEVPQTDGSAKVQLSEANPPASDETKMSEEALQHALETSGEVPQSNGGATVQFSTATYTVNRNETASALITVTRQGPTSGTTSVKYATDSGQNDYIPASGTLTFEPGETRQVFAIEVTDKLSDQTTVVGLALTTPVGAKLGSPSKSQVRFLPESARESIFASLFHNPETANVLKHIGLAVSLILGFYLLSDFILNKDEAHSAKWASYLKPHTSQPPYETDGLFKVFFFACREGSVRATVGDDSRTHAAPS